MIQSNTIEGNAQGGIMLVGSSATVQGNTVSGNGGTGIVAASDLGEHPDPSMAYDDVIARPRIGSLESPNTIHGHPDGGVRLEEARAVNSDTIETDNVLGGNGPYEVAQTWLGLAEVFSPSLEPLSGVQVEILGAGGVSLGISGVSNGAGIVGPPGYSVTDARTWWRVPEFAVIEEGALTQGRELR